MPGTINYWTYKAEKLLSLPWFYRLGTVMPIIITQCDKYNKGGMYKFQWKHREAKEASTEEATIELRCEGWERIF